MNPLVSEKKESAPILVVDRIGTIGSVLCEKLSFDTQVVFVSKKQTELKNVISVDFSKKFPAIPDGIYSHTFIVDDENSVTRDLFSTFIKKAREDRGTLIVVTGLENQNIITEEMLEYKGAKVIFFGDIIDKSINKKSIVQRIINQAKLRGRIDIPGEGTDIVYPVFFSDIIDGIFEASFGNSPDKIYYIFPRHGVTTISFAHMIQKSNPSITVDFVNGEGGENISILREGNFLLPEDYPLEEKIRNLKIEISNLKDELKEEKYKEYKPSKSKGILRTYIFFLIFFIFLPLLTTLLFSILGSTFLSITKLSFGNGDFKGAKEDAYLAKTLFVFSEKTSNLYLWETNGLIFSNYLNDISENGLKIATGVEDFFQGLDLLSQNKIPQSVEAFKSFLIFVQGEKIEGKNSEFLKADLVNLATATVDVWPQILGFDRTKNYLVLFQNNMELRPTGGVIGSYGVLTVNKGNVESFSVKDTYDADSQLKGHVEPPFALRRYLPSPHWYLRDSNFDLDFTRSASTAAFLFNTETNQKVDGVIAVDLNFVKNILKATGPVYVSDYHKNITADNLFEETQLQVTNSQPGSKQKKEFLTALFSTLKNSLENKKFYKTVLDSLGGSVFSKDIIFASSEQNVQNIFTANGLSSSLWDERAELPKNINDFLGLNEANLGGNKANYTVGRKVRQDVTLSDNGEISSVLTVEFTNSNTSKFSADYKNYLRFILPDASQVNSIKIDGQLKDTVLAVTDPNVYEDKNFVAPKELEVESYNESGKTVVGFLTVIPKGKSQTIEISYNLPKKPVLASLGNFSYSLSIFKQPGVDLYPYVFNLNFPKTWQVLKFPQNVTGNDGVVSFSKNIDRDMELSLDFSQK